MIMIYTSEVRSAISLYADDTLLISTSVCQLEKLLHICEEELFWLDMAINFKKFCCLRVGLRIVATTSCW